MESNTGLEAEDVVDSTLQARRRADVGQISLEGTQTRWRTLQEEGDEQRPLLEESPDAQGPDNYSGDEDVEDEFAHFKGMPWHKRPSVNWMLGPFLVLTLAVGGTMVPELNLLLALICRDYISDRAKEDPTFHMTPVVFDGPNPQCKDPHVQARVATLTLTISLVAGILSAITSPKIGALSDRYGRKLFLMLGSIGSLCNLTLYIFASLYAETFPPKLILVGSALDGICGSFIAYMVLANAYATDCTPPARRNIAFSLMHACLFAGIGFGPLVAAELIRLTGQIVSVFYFAVAAQLCFILFLIFVIPESLSKSRQQAARDRHTQQQQQFAATTTSQETSDWRRHIRSLNLFEPLKILYPTGPGTSHAIRRNLIALAAVDTIMFGVAMGSMTVVIIYTAYAFDWDVIQQSDFRSIANISRVLGLVVILPTIIRLVRGPASSRPKAAATRRGSAPPGADSLDLHLIRAAVLLDTLGYIGYAVSRTGSAFTISACIAALGGIGSPTIQSALTKHVPSDKTGQLLGAMGLLHALARVMGPTVFNSIYALTVARYPAAVFACLAAAFGCAFVVSWGGQGWSFA